MNATRRGLNRFILFLVALVLLGLGALALAVGLLPGGTTPDLRHGRVPGLARVARP